MKSIRIFSKEMDKIVNRLSMRKKRTENRVAKIIDDLKNSGDDALVRYTRRFDKIKLLPRQFRVSEAEINGAYQNIDTKFVSNLKEIIGNVERFYRKRLKKCWRMKAEDGVVLGENVFPLKRVGIYVPAGTAPLVSTIYMTVIPAKVAGVEEIVLATPPNKAGFVDPHILVIASLLKVKEIFKIGGAQAIAALALGTKTVKKVDKIVGPGNIYVTEAKRQLFGYVDVDMLAGPSEVAIIANRSVAPDFVFADLKAQSEHNGGLSFLITTSKGLAKSAKREVEKGFVILVRNLEQAVEVANLISPEHLEILVKNPRSLIKKIRNAGCIFVGAYSPVAVGDYIAGPSHVLPTAGSSRFFSALGVEDFQKSSHLIIYSKKALEKSRGLIETIAGIEGMTKHIDSVKIRL